MSFILDALRKAEDKNRNRHNMTAATGPRVLDEEFAEAPRTKTKPALVVAIIGLITLASVWWILSEPESTTPAASARANTGDNNEQALPVASARTNQQPLPSNELPAERPNIQRETGARALDREARRGLASSGQSATSSGQQATANTPSTSPDRRTPTRTVTPGTVRIMNPDGSVPDTTPGKVTQESLPEYRTSLASGDVPIPQLHLDMHVFSAQPEKRFVFINLEKYVEGDAIDTDTSVESIEPEGAVINHKGYRFVLRPE